MKRTVFIQVLECSDCAQLALGVKSPRDEYTGQRITLDTKKAHCSGKWNILLSERVNLEQLESYADPRPASKPLKKPNKKARA